MNLWLLFFKTGIIVNKFLTKNRITMLYKIKKWKIASFFTKLCKVEPHKTKGDPWTWVSIVHIWLMTCFKGYFKSSYSQWLSDQRQSWSKFFLLWQKIVIENVKKLPLAVQKVCHWNSILQYLYFILIVILKKYFILIITFVKAKI